MSDANARRGLFNTGRYCLYPWPPVLNNHVNLGHVPTAAAAVWSENSPPASLSTCTSARWRAGCGLTRFYYTACIQVQGFFKKMIWPKSMAADCVVVIHKGSKIRACSAGCYHRGVSKNPFGLRIITTPRSCGLDERSQSKNTSLLGTLSKN